MGPASPAENETKSALENADEAHEHARRGLEAALDTLVDGGNEFSRSPLRRHVRVGALADPFLLPCEVPRCGVRAIELRRLAPHLPVGVAKCGADLKSRAGLDDAR